jgi:hypothetical protein
MWLRTSCDMAFDIPLPTLFILMLRPRSGVQQWIGSSAKAVRAFTEHEKRKNARL